MIDDFESFLRKSTSAPPAEPPALKPPALPQPSSFEEFLARSKGERQQQAAATVVINAEQSAATAAEAAKVSREIDLPPAVVETDLPRYKSQALAQKNTTLLQSNPVLANWVAANPDSARIAQEEYEQLSTVEKAWRGTSGTAYAALQGLGGSFNQAALAFNKIVSGTLMLSGARTAQDFWQRQFVLPAERDAKAFQLEPDAGILKRTANMVGGLLGMLSQIQLTGGTGGQALSPLAGATETIVNAVQTASRTMAFPALTASVNKASEVYEKTGDLKLANTAAISEYFWTLAIGVVPFSAPGSVAQRMGTGAIAGAVQSEAQRGLNNLLMPPELQRGFSAEEAAFQAFTGALLGGVMGPRSEPNLYRAVRETYSEAFRAEQSESGIQRVQALSEIASQSKLREADPQAFRQLIEQISDKTDVDAVYVDAKTMAEALKQSPVDLARVMPDVAKELAEAQASGAADVRIPVADYATHIAGTPLEAPLLASMKTAPDGMTLAESQQFFKDAKKTLEAKAAEVSQQQAETIKAKAERETVYADVLGQLESTQRFPSDVNKAYATMTADFFNVLSERTGEPVKDLFEKYGLRIAAEDTVSGEVKVAPEAAPVDVVAVRKRGAILKSLLECLA